ncbi:hepcidin [Pelodiscus sinensis]|uniref:Hepcidin antimicrobial peptide n=1 Tax=Pelodiscus sinensis TaxID=13735 RepID=A0A2R4A6B9_PELSI|nr:hepcidin [Pelodiscus sinensis]AVR58611.1 hepcidin antimicrobial peptide [Pelodiscus sinensis]|eukprot:XP_025043064.1 hepcidin [Pelodiscus sinensis]
MRLQITCLILTLILFSAQNACGFQGQTAEPAAVTQHVEPREETQGLQALLRRPKRHNSHFPICTFCCKCCHNQGCGFCCRT